MPSRPPMMLFLLSTSISLVACDPPVPEQAESPSSHQSLGLTDTGGPTTEAIGTFLPPLPANLWDVTPVKGGTFDRPNLPPMRFSQDVRVGLRIEGGIGLELVVPEKLDAPFLESAPGTEILASGSPANLSPARFHRSSVQGGLLVHRALCDPSAQFPRMGVTLTPNPSVCGTDGQDDCYSLTVIAGYVYTDANDIEWGELWGTPVLVQVANPKTRLATIRHVETFTPERGARFRADSFFEPMVTSDGHLLTARLSGTEFTWFNERTGRNVTGTYDIVYSMGDPIRKAPCDVTQWEGFKPITHAPHDVSVSERYGFASQPFRDPSGKPMPDGANLRATYPWLDREGRNLFFTTLSRQLYLSDNLGRIKTKYEAQCVAGTDCTLNPASQKAFSELDEPSRTRGFTVMGLWTQGKAVLLDSKMNNIDYGLGCVDSEQRQVRLYNDDNGWVRVGCGRDNRQTSMPAGASRNTTLLDSPENLLNASSWMRPRTPRDVVWLMLSGKVSDEVAFDDYLDPNGFIVAQMQGAMLGETGVEFEYQDGFVNTSGGANLNGDRRLMNTATALPKTWAIPRYGAIVGQGRIEPVALGGVHGRGFWLTTTSAVRFAVPEQPQDPLKKEWFINLFIDPRFADDLIRRELISYPDGSGLELEGLSRLVLRGQSGRDVAVFPIPAALKPAQRKWTAIGLKVEGGGSRVTVYLDGMRLAQWTAEAWTRLFQLRQGVIRLGDNPNTDTKGFRGWMDDFKVFATQFDDEVICNHARGTLMGLDPSYSGVWRTRANSYDPTVHDELRTRVTGARGPSFSRFACYSDHRREHGASHLDPPSFAISVRHFLLFREGPLKFGHPRPRSSVNGFCLNCHHLEGLKGLSLAALPAGSGTMENDPRRQPLQAPRLFFGNLSTQVLGTAGPAAPIKSGPEGILLDQWLHPAQ